MSQTARAYWELMRLDRPVGTFLLLWPTLAALWLAAEGFPLFKILIVFVLGTFVMRAAGCVVNDIADHRFDPHVERTKSRPLADGRLSVRQALICFAVLLLAGLALIFLLNPITRWMAVIGVVVSVIYPFMKRFTNLPQVGLGVAFSWGIPMAGTAVQGYVPLSVWLLFAASFVWVIAYDTEYAMVDRDDDAKLGLKSTAILLGRFDVLAIAILYTIVVGLLVAVGFIAHLHWLYFVSLLVVVGLFIHQLLLIRSRDREDCFRAFQNNTIVGCVIFLGVAASYFVSNGMA